MPESSSKIHLMITLSRGSNLAKAGKKQLVIAGVRSREGYGQNRPIISIKVPRGKSCCPPH